MQTRQIPQDQWVPFLDGFSRQHQGQKVTVELLAQDTGPQAEARDLPLLGITYDPKDSDRFRIELSVGGAGHVPAGGGGCAPVGVL